MKKVTPINRREFITRSGTALAGVAFANPKSYAMENTEESAKTPNVLLIMTDQQFADAMSCAGNPWVKTPAMDRLAERGVRFTKAYCSNPICGPSRSSIITGLHSHQTGIQVNVDHGDMQGESFAKSMLESGYRTGFVGKWHSPIPVENTAWSGYEFTAENRYNELDPFIPAPSIDFIRKNDERPWFLVSSFVNPHDICQWARIASGMDDKLLNGDIPPVPPPEECPPLPPNLEAPNDESTAIRDYQTHPNMSGTYPTVGWPDERWRQYHWAFYRMVERVDREIGKILDVLDEDNLWDDTVILFTSDHGDGLGAHRWNQKVMFYEESARVPMIICDPKSSRRGVTDNALVNIGTDLAATCMAAAGVKPEKPLEGINLLETTRNQAHAQKHNFVIAQNNLNVEAKKEGPVSGRMLRGPRFKYTIYSAGKNREMLFDLDQDPGEMKNLAPDPAWAAVLEEHRQQLLTWMKDKNDPFIKYLPSL